MCPFPKPPGRSRAPATVRSEARRGQGSAALASAPTPLIGLHRGQRPEPDRTEPPLPGRPVSTSRFHTPPAASQAHVGADSPRRVTRTRSASREGASHGVGAQSSLGAFQGQSRDTLLPGVTTEKSPNLQPESMPSYFPGPAPAQVDNGIIVTSAMSPRRLPWAEGSFQSWMGAAGSSSEGQWRVGQDMVADKSWGRS